MTHNNMIKYNIMLEPQIFEDKNIRYPIIDESGSVWIHDYHPEIEDFNEPYSLRNTKTFILTCIFLSIICFLCNHRDPNNKKIYLLIFILYILYFSIYYFINFSKELEVCTFPNFCIEGENNTIDYSSILFISQKEEGCYSPLDMGNLYAEDHTEMDECNNSTYGCCSIDLTCKVSIEEEYGWDTYVHKKHVISIPLEKQNVAPMNCPLLPDIIQYQLYKKKVYDIYFYFKGMFSFVMVQLFIYYILSFIEKKGKYQKTGRTDEDTNIP